MDLAIIAAVSENGVIGAAGGLPWHYPEDLRYFKKVTTGHPVLMGRRTYESIVDRLDEPLPDRTNVVMTRGGYRPDNEEVIVTGSLEGAVDAAAETGAVTAYVIGGASIFRQTLEQNLADRLVVTHIPDTYEGDTYWPGPEFADLAVVDRTPLGDELEAITYDLHGQR